MERGRWKIEDGKKREDEKIMESEGGILEKRKWKEDRGWKDEEDRNAKWGVKN
jgi:hypothetical protein